MSLHQLTDAVGIRHKECSCKPFFDQISERSALIPLTVLPVRTLVDRECGCFGPSYDPGPGVS